MKLKRLFCVLFLAVLTISACGKKETFDETKAADETEAVSISRNNFTTIANVTSAMYEKNPITMYYWRDHVSYYIALDVCTAHNKKLSNDLHCKDYDGSSACSPLLLNTTNKAGSYIVTNGEIYTNMSTYKSIK